jgi:hypothetical protein
MENLNERELELNWLESYASEHVWAHFGDGKKFMVPLDASDPIFEDNCGLILINGREPVTLDEIVDRLGENASSFRRAAEALKYADASSEP